MSVSFKGKCLLIEEGTKKKERVLVIGDLHLGYEERFLEAGVSVGRTLYQEMKNELASLILSCGTLHAIVLLGDVKHGFGKGNSQEWNDIGDLLTFLQLHASKVIVIRGNHDTFLMNISIKQGVSVCTSWSWKGYCFVHGDQDSPTLHHSSVHTWVIGHVHPAISFTRGSKREVYKCFLEGRYKGKNIYIVPSFFSGVIGSDIQKYDLEVPWQFNLDSFYVHVVEGKEVFAFGKVSKL